MGRIRESSDYEELKKFLQDGYRLMGQINRIYRKLDPNSTEYIRYQQILIWMLGAYIRIINYEMDECVKVLLQDDLTQYTNQKT